jgi:hypothetical protein
MTFFVSISLNFKLYALLNESEEYEPVGAISKNGAVSSTLNLSIDADSRDIFIFINNKHKNLLNFFITVFTVVLCYRY